MLISVVVPCYNEEQVIARDPPPTCRRVGRARGTDFEIVYVDDGSNDATLDRLRKDSKPRRARARGAVVAQLRPSARRQRRPRTRCRRC